VGAFQQVGGFDGLRSQITEPGATNSYTDLEALQGTGNEDLTKRFYSLNATSRIPLWKVAWENWREHPLTGTGGDTYQVVYDEKAPDAVWHPLSPHSMWMSLLSDTGVFAFLAFAAFCVGCLTLACYNAFSTRRSLRSRAIVAGSAAAFTVYLVASSVDPDWYVPAATVPFFALAAVMVSVPRGDAHRLTRSKPH